MIRTAAAHREVRPTTAVLVHWVGRKSIDGKGSDDSEGRRPQVVDGRHGQVPGRREVGLGILTRTFVLTQKKGGFWFTRAMKL